MHQRCRTTSTSQSVFITGHQEYFDRAALPPCALNRPYCASSSVMESADVWRSHDEHVIEAAREVGMPADELSSLVNGIRELGRVLVAFAGVTRDSQLDRNGTAESDTDHTVTLAIVACAVAARHLKRLDLGKVAQFCLVHDLVEAYCGDTSTWDFKIDRSDKERREELARTQIKNDLAAFPWLSETIQAYESLAEPEARFVKALDKAMPALLHNLNDGILFETGEDRDPERFQNGIRSKTSWLREQPYARDDQDCLHHEAALAFGIREALMEHVIARHWEKHLQGKEP